MNPTRTESTQGQLTPITPSAEESLAKISASLGELVAIQRETMASISGLWDMAEVASEMLRVNWLEKSGFAWDESDKRLLVKRLKAGGEYAIGRILDRQTTPPPCRSSNDSRPA